MISLAHGSAITSRRFDPAWSAPLALVCLGLAFAAIPIAKSITRPDCTGNKDYTLWYEIGIATRAGAPLYEAKLNGETKYQYPPTMAVLVYAPLSALGPTAFVTILAIGTAIAWAAAAAMALVLTTGRWRGHPRWVYVVPAFAVGTYLWDLQLLGQVNMVLLALVLGAFLLARHQRSFLGGTLLGTAIAVKAFPLPMIAYFIARRDWRGALGTAVGTIIMAAVLPAALRGLDPTTAELQQWATITFGDGSAETVGARTSIGFSRRNQSLTSVSHRLLRDVHAGEGDAAAKMNVNVANVSPRTAQMVGLGASTLLAALLLAVTRLRFGVNPLAEGIEVAMVVTLAVLASPISWTYFYCWLLPAWTVMAVAIASAKDVAARRIAVVGSLLAGVLLALAVSEQFDPTLQAYGATAWGGVTLFLTMAVLRGRIGHESEAIPEQIPLRQAA
jgi:hypothetical protein